MDKEKLQKDKAKYEGELSRFDEQLQIVLTNRQRLSGIIAYINLCLKEELDRESIKPEEDK